MCCLPALIEVDEEDDIISETGQLMGSGGSDNSTEHITDECIQALMNKTVLPRSYKSIIHIQVCTSVVCNI